MAVQAALPKGKSAQQQEDADEVISSEYDSEGDSNGYKEDFEEEEIQEEGQIGSKPQASRQV